MMSEYVEGPAMWCRSTSRAQLCDVGVRRGPSYVMSEYVEGPAM